jgi:Domain of unknown function DUF29
VVSKPMASNQSLYDRDFYAWANEQASLLRDGRLADADIPNIAEEIESMGRSEKRELINRLAVLMTHLLKWQFQPMRRSASWRLTMKEQRLRLAAHLRDNPSLKAHLDDAAREAFDLALVEAQHETGFDEKTFPAACPWPLNSIMSNDWVPE